MRLFSMMAGAFLTVASLGLASCGDDDKRLSAEQQAYIHENRAYLWEKKAEKDDDGKLRYEQVVVSGDTALYRITRKENDWKSLPTITSLVTVTDMEGRLISGRVFQQKAGKPLRFQMNTLIPGFAAVLLNVHPDETVEMILPANLGYGNMDHGGIPGGSTLVFTLTLDKIQ